MNIDPFHADLRTAIHIKKALDNIYRLDQLGYCPTKVQKFRKYFHLDGREEAGSGSDTDEEMGSGNDTDEEMGSGNDTDEEEGSGNDTDEEDSSGRNEIHMGSGNNTDEDSSDEIPKKGFKRRDLANQEILDELRTVSKDLKSLSTSYTSGNFNYYFSFDLRITRPGCEFNGQVRQYMNEIDDLLPVWFEHSAISGYGDVQSFQTKVDSEVRHAREILASEFEVQPKLLEKIQDLWGEHFLPRKVRAQPYKIHLYGPGGHFKSHRDTPETDLVGTFLIGLGDTSSTSEGNFRIGDKTLRAKRDTWVAFHPDKLHEVTKLKEGYRAVLAFKIIRVDSTEPEVFPALLENRVKRILDQIPAPFGLLTAHQYSIGTTNLTGFDVLLMAYARSRYDTQAHMLPVVTKFRGEAYDDDDDPRAEDYQSFTESRVYPFTRSHVDILLGKDVDQSKKAVMWLKKWSGIPFYAWDIDASLQVWTEDHPDGANYTGNEADSQREDSVYLSHAILFLPKFSQ